MYRKKRKIAACIIHVHNEFHETFNVNTYIWSRLKAKCWVESHLALFNASVWRGILLMQGLIVSWISGWYFKISINLFFWFRLGWLFFLQTPVCFLWASCLLSFATVLLCFFCSKNVFKDLSMCHGADSSIQVKFSPLGNSSNNCRNNLFPEWSLYWCCLIIHWQYEVSL